MFEQIVLASNNTNKLKEFTPWFAEQQINLLPQTMFNVPECAEPHFSFIENAIAKARHASKYSGKCALADDSGICAEALGGAPGIYSARFAGNNPQSDSANNAKLSEQLAAHTNKNCYYVCVLALVRYEHDPQPLIAEGTWHGLWQEYAVGNNGFGYDPHFYLPEYSCTAAELLPEVKNRISHRGLALAELKKKIKSLSI